MVANGLIFCLDAAEKVLYACEGLSTEATIFPVAKKGRWALGDLDMNTWLEVETVTRGNTVTVSIQGRQLARIEDLDIRPILGGSPNNTGSVAFGGPCQWVSRYRKLSVKDAEGHALYENDFLRKDEARTLSDFQVGTNALACTIDGAKRDRACFGGDLHVMGRSIAHSTIAFEAIAGSIELLTSHQTADGYLGNLCPIQAPIHNSKEEPPTYAFYSLSYALLLVVAIKDYWLHTGDETTRSRCLESLERLMAYTARFVSQGVVVAPPPLSMHWFPLGGPVFGASSALNNAYYEALQAMATLSTDAANQNKYSLQAYDLKVNMLRHFYDTSTGVYHLDRSLPASGICQDVKAHAITLDLLPYHCNDLDHLIDSNSGLPRAFRGLGHWDVANVSSPYATGFAVEALFSRDRGTEALKLLERVWGPMADPASPNYSGGHWEAMKPDGIPHGHDTSLMHGWSTWPVSLMPRYLAGLQPTTPGWKTFSIAPVLAGLTNVKCVLETVAGTVGVDLDIDEAHSHGALKVLAPYGVRAQLHSPQGWVIQGPETIEGTGEWQKFFLSEAGGDSILETKSASMQFEAIPTSAFPVQDRQGSNLPSKIRSLFSRFTSIRA
ncbi:hypothetical protein N0V95_003102 [Ascochyta clinopodiicola]|nr:hypothetical protein N0V95_003102 [Ascochyta clinopodiicola]